MKIHSLSLVMASALTMGLAVPAMAQQSMHRYAVFFKYADNAVKAMTENPQDRSAQGSKATESFGGKQDAFYLFPAGGEFDGMAIAEFPDQVTAEGLNLFVRSTGNFTRFQIVPICKLRASSVLRRRCSGVNSSAGQRPSFGSDSISAKSAASWIGLKFGRAAHRACRASLAVCHRAPVRRHVPSG
jgi:uncharacterized protein with GYD domain